MFINTNYIHTHAHMQYQTYIQPCTCMLENMVMECKLVCKVCEYGHGLWDIRVSHYANELLSISYITACVGKFIADLYAPAENMRFCM